MTSTSWTYCSVAYRAWIVCVVLALPSAASGIDRCGSLERAANAIHLAQIIYPELKGAEFSLQFSEGTGGPLSGPTDVGSLVIAVDKPQWHSAGDTTPPRDSALRSSPARREIELPLYLKFGFIRFNGKPAGVSGRDLSCQPLDFMNHKTSKQMLEAAEIINAHPEWTDAQEVEAAKKVGMRFGPEKKAEVLRLLPLTGLSSVYGSFRITKAYFSTASPKQPGSYFADLHWYITAQISRTQHTLQITVEPFYGKITALSR